jgi:DNA polymerase (family 10)
MKNQEIAKIFYSIAEYLKVDDIPFKPQAYEKAAIALETLEEDAAKIYKQGGLKALEEISGVGVSIAEKIEEYLKTGKIKYYEQLKKKLPIDLNEITGVEGVGPKKAKVLYQKLGIRNLRDLEKAAKTHKIAPLSRFGEKTEKNILEGIEFLKRSHGRFLLGEILPKVKEVYEKLSGLKEIEKLDTAGSIRRRKETIGDVDFLAVVGGSVRPASAKASAGKIMDFFVSLPGIVKVWGKGATKASVRMKEGFDMDIRVVSPKQYGSALQYFTGSKEHNVALRKIAIDKEMKLNEYGLFRGRKMVAGKTEEEIYKKLGMDWIPPELREDRGEIEASIKGKLPELIELEDIKGDLHVHSDWDGGVNSIEDLAKAAKDAGYEYIGIADHTKFLRIEHGLDEKQLEERNKEIDRINKRFSAKGGSVTGGQVFKILKGCEANIMADGSIDINDKTLAKMDFVIAGVHSQMKMTREQMTQRVIKAMKNPHVDIISHPTGRILKRRDEFQIDFDKILKVAKESGTILEINAYPERLDLDDINIKKAKDMGVKMVINTDAHHKDQLRYMEYGVSQARRGWAEKNDIINCWGLDKLLEFLK